jgi:HK97 family phage portal protein
MEGDFDWKEMGLSPKDLDFVEGKNISAREIAQAFGVPPMLVGVPGDATFANYREARFHLWEDTIIPLVEYITAELNLWLLPQFSENLRLAYDLDSIPALAPRREAAWAKIASADFLTINEKRQAVGYSPVSDGDRLGYS